MNKIVIHGREYRGISEVRERMADLHRMNQRIGPSDGRVTERRALVEWLNANVKPVPDRVFYVYYRTASGGKGYKEFKTERGRSGWMDRTVHAVTAWGDR